MSWCVSYGRRYIENTKPGYGSMDLYDVWTVDRAGEAERFAAHDKIANRKLLWHGTNGGKWLSPPPSWSLLCCAVFYRSIILYRTILYHTIV